MNHKMKEATRTTIIHPSFPQSECLRFLGTYLVIESDEVPGEGSGKSLMDKVREKTEAGLASNTQGASANFTCLGTVFDRTFFSKDIIENKYGLTRRIRTSSRIWTMYYDRVYIVKCSNFELQFCREPICTSASAANVERDKKKKALPSSGFYKPFPKSFRSISRFCQ